MDDLKTESARDLIERAKAGDEAAFAALYAATHGEVIRLVRGVLREYRSHTQEMVFVNDFYMKVLNKFELRSMAQLRGWVKLVTLNALRDKARKERETIDLEDADLPVFDDPIGVELLVRVALAKLRPKLRQKGEKGERAYQVFCWYYFDGESVSAIAEKLRLGERTIEADLACVRFALQRALEPLGKK